MAFSPAMRTAPTPDSSAACSAGTMSSAKAFIGGPTYSASLASRKRPIS